MREQSERDFKSDNDALDDLLVGDVTGSSGFFIVGDFLGERVGDSPGDPSPSLGVELECRGGDILDLAGNVLDFEGDVLDLEGGLTMGLGSLAFNGEVKLLLGILVLGFVSAAGLDD